ncbi:DUF2939 domain-containing protein [Paraburkholderia kururiensis]|uniref:DUF2939 domain-containing protein n=1 Tax=Paraburkholderia kururiensis TaxID=984307 RepID=UPI001F0BB221|nr:DUF2939 domain-containing protein [Paraburkholderia kururiensis]
MVAVLGYAYASPYIVLDRLKRAADARDAETVNAYVDYPALRVSLKQQVTELLMRRIDAQKHGNPFAVIGALIGASLIGPLVDAYATPDGVAAILNGMPPRGQPGERPPPAGTSGGTPNPEAGSTASTAPSTGQTPAAPATPQAPNQAPAQAPAQAPTQAQTPPPQPPQTTAGYRSLNEFVVTYQHGVGDTRYAAILRRDGLFSWKLSAVDLNG